MICRGGLLLAEVWPMSTREKAASVVAPQPCSYSSSPPRATCLTPLLRAIRRWVGWSYAGRLWIVRTHSKKEGRAGQGSPIPPPPQVRTTMPLTAWEGAEGIWKTSPLPLLVWVGEGINGDIFQWRTPPTTKCLSSTSLLRKGKSFLLRQMPDCVKGRKLHH